MMKNIGGLLVLVCAVVMSSCEGCGDAEDPVNSEIRWVNDVTVFETADLGAVALTVTLDQINMETVSVDYASVPGTATEGDDFIPVSGTLVFQPGEFSKEISIEIVSDEYLEQDEFLTVELSNPVNGYIKIGASTASIGIRNDDTMIYTSDEGYEASESYEGKSLIWSDEFEGETIDLNNWTYDLGNGSGGWGNNELQTYTSSTNNSFVADGKLFIVAEKEGEGAYTSARLKSLNLQDFEFGRIDVRAILPKGQGIWPAIWMLGANYPEQGWPACGEIDIMELLGHLPGTVHGTAHWGIDWSNWNHQGLSTSIYPANFDEEFHVFSIDWSEDNIDFIMDDDVFFNINPSMMNGQPYPFNNPFFFILNVAVGGNWPGYPDETTTFPVFMAVDYVRVYQ
tara:strand:- start:1737 stop:2927 length:1191 start_codon:yes stop_codon:yes gene_type:complete